MAEWIEGEKEFWLKAGKGQFWFIERKDGFDVYLQEPMVETKIWKNKKLVRVEKKADPRAKKVTR